MTVDNNCTLRTTHRLSLSFLLYFLLHLHKHVVDEKFFVLCHYAQNTTRFVFSEALLHVQVNHFSHFRLCATSDENERGAGTSLRISIEMNAQRTIALSLPHSIYIYIYI